VNKPHIYKITNNVNGKFYYGVHDGSNTETYMGSGVALKKAYKKYGIDNFSKEILLWFDSEEEAYEYEAVVVNQKMVNNPQSYNITIGGKGGFHHINSQPSKLIGFKHTEEAKRNMSKAAIKKFENNAELRKSLSEHALDQHQKMISEGKSLADRFKNGVKYKCSHCGKETSKGNWKRWHQNNCKKRKSNV